MDDKITSLIIRAKKFIHKDKTINVLLIDNNHMAVELMRDIVDFSIKDIDVNSNVIVDEFYSIKEFSSNKKNRYDIALVDWNIGDGIEEKGNTVIEQIKSNCKNIAIVSGQTDKNIEIAKYSIKNKILFIQKGCVDNFGKVNRFIARSIRNMNIK